MIHDLKSKLQNNNNNINNNNNNNNNNNTNNLYLYRIKLGQLVQKLLSECYQNAIFRIENVGFDLRKQNQSF